MKSKRQKSKEVLQKDDTIWRPGFGNSKTLNSYGEQTFLVFLTCWQTSHLVIEKFKFFKEDFGNLFASVLNLIRLSKKLCLESC